MRPPALPLVLACALALVLSAGGPRSGPASASAAPTESTYSAHAVTATNKARVAHDRKELGTDACLQGFADRHASAMAAEESMYHQELGPIMEKCGLRSVGENVAYGYPSGRAVVRRGWLKSEGHRANILNRGFRLVAVAGRTSQDGTWYAVQVFGRAA